MEITGGAKIRNRAYPPRSYGATTLSAYYDETSEAQWNSFLVPLIVTANVVMFIITMFLNNCPQDGHRTGCVVSPLERFSFQPLSENPLFGPSSSVLEQLGALDWNKIVLEHQQWRLVTCIWLHAGLVHLLTNFFSLIFFGFRLEKKFGFVRVGLIYLLSGTSGSILSSFFIQYSINVGASGSLFGLLGAMLSELITNWTIYRDKALALFTLLVIILINLTVGIFPHVNNFANIGGFFSGFLLGFVLLVLPRFGWNERRHLPREAEWRHLPREDARLTSKYTTRQLVFLVAASVLFITGYTVGFVMVFIGQNANAHCSWCHYISCVPTSRWDCNN